MKDHRSAPGRHTSAPLHSDARLGSDFGISAEGVVYYLKARSADYGPDYFLEEYRNQYGRTYFEDEDVMRSSARRRLDLLRRYVGTPGLNPRPRMLEVGCAAGFFLAEARDAGYEAEGLDVSEFALRHASEKLGLKVHRQSFLDFESETGFDVVSAFYVLEHFAEQNTVFAKVSELLKPGGAFMFALPSTHGPLFMTDPARWVETHPMDHFADYSPRSLQRILPLYGLKLKTARPATFHPKRMQSPIPWAKFPALYRFMARMRSFGDTMECIAVKTS